MQNGEKVTDWNTLGSDWNEQDTIVAIGKILTEWGLPSNSQIKLISLSENAVFLVENLQVNKKLALRVHFQGYNTPIEIDSELTWLSAIINETDLKTVKPVPTQKGTLRRTLADGRSVVAFEYIDGIPIKSSTDMRITMEKLGAMTAKLHVHSMKWCPPKGFQRKIWDFQNCVGQNAIFGDWRNSVGLSNDGYIMIANTVSVLERRLQSWGVDDNHFGLIHGDLKSANLLIGSDGPILLDFDDCGFGWYLYDFGCAATDLKVEDIDKCASNWAKGYRSVSPLSDLEEKMLPTFALLRRIMTMAWAGSHRFSPVAMQDYGVDYTETSLKFISKLLTRDMII